MIKISLFDRKNCKVIEVFSELSSFKYYRKYCCSGQYIFLAWSSKKNNFNCWH